EALLAYVAHELRRKRPESGTEQERERDVAVLGLPHQRHAQRSELDAPSDAADLRRVERRRKDVGLRRHRDGLLRRCVDVLPEPGPYALVMCHERADRGIGTRM